jgi:hypothetical protein
MSAKYVETIVESGTESFIPLNKLKKSPKNARKTPHSDAAIEALAASIAAKGILQNLVVEPELDGEGAATGFYLVTVGEGRRLAQLLRAKRKEIKKTEPIRCIIDTANDAHDISLDEKVTRENMHPADQFEGWKWTEAHLDFPHAHGMRRVYPHKVELSLEDQAALEAARHQVDQLSEWHQTTDEIPDHVDVRFCELEAEIDRLEAKRQAYDPDDVARDSRHEEDQHGGSRRTVAGANRLVAAPAEDGQAARMGRDTV